MWVSSSLISSKPIKIKVTVIASVFIVFSFLQAAHETEVKAQVKLSFKDVTGKQAVVTRNLTATQKVVL